MIVSHLKGRMHTAQKIIGIDILKASADFSFNFRGNNSRVVLGFCKLHKHGIDILLFCIIGERIIKGQSPHGNTGDNQACYHKEKENNFFLHIKISFLPWKTKTVIFGCFPVQGQYAKYPRH